MPELFQFEDRFRKAFENAVIPFAVYQYVDHKVRTLLVTDGLCDLMGVTREELVQRFNEDMYTNVHPQEIYAIAQEAVRFATEGGAYDVVYREKLKGSSEYSMIHAAGYHVMTQQGIQIAVVQYDDITKALHSTDNVRKVFESTVEQFYENAELAISIVAREHDTLLYTNRAFEKILPPVRKYDSGISYWEYFFAADGAPPEHTLAGHCGKGRFIASDPVHNHPVVLNIREAIWNGQDCYVIQIEDLDKVYLDQLTGLANQDYLEQTAAEHIRKTLETGRKAACIFYDVANMKLYNAKHGYDQGDQLLRDVARILQRNFSNALGARLYADHFCLITSDEELEDKLQHVDAEMEKLGGQMKVETNAGVKLIESAEDIDVSLMIDQAKTACDAVHDDADLHYGFFDEKMEKAQQDQKFVDDHIDEAIANGEIQVYFQPVIRTLSRKLCGFEALARWISPELGFLAPYRFIPALEQSHQIHKVDCYIIEQICKEYRLGTDRGVTAVPVSFNLSRLDFQMCDMFQYVQDMTAKYNVPHNMLCVEITETVLTDDDSLIQEAIAKFHEAGYEVWMDDFGSGYSSLNSLKDHQFDKLKIDMVFLSSFTERSQKIIASIVQMAKNIGIHTLAEGVETAEQFEFLRSIGCEQVQGYFFDKPQPLFESLAHVRDMGVFEETPAEASYVARAGMKILGTEEPTAVLECSKDQYRFMLINRPYMKTWQSVGLDKSEDTLKLINDPAGVYYESFRARVAQAEEEGGHVHFAFQYRKYYMSMTIDILSRMEERFLVKLTLSNAWITGGERDQEEEPKQEPEQQETDLPTILIADDEPVNLVLIGEMLKSHYNILYAEDGATALKLVRENRNVIAAVLLDMVMPQMTGLDVLRALRSEEETRYLPVLAMTSATDLQEEFLREGANQFLPKPFETPGVIMAKIDNVIQNSKIHE